MTEKMGKKREHRAGGEAQVLEHLPHKHKAPSSNPSTNQKERKEEQ
jgi:hypothetical protein